MLNLKDNNWQLIVSLMDGPGICGAPVYGMDDRLIKCLGPFCNVIHFYTKVVEGMLESLTENMEASIERSLNLYKGWRKRPGRWIQ